jgi:EAL domain-containing protein (putative c-di-GMP-specific phosphodiesterase class I)
MSSLPLKMQVNYKLSNLSNLEKNKFDIINIDIIIIQNIKNPLKNSIV